MLKQFIASAPPLFFGSALDAFTGGDDTPPLQQLRQLNPVAPDLWKCIWDATEPDARPSLLSVFDVALSDQLYATAHSIFLAFGESSQHKAAFTHFLNRKNESGNSLYAEPFAVSVFCSLCADGMLRGIRPMVLARRYFSHPNPKLLSGLLDLLDVVVRSGAVDVSAANSNGETLASVVGADSAQNLSARLQLLKREAKVPAKRET